MSQETPFWPKQITIQEVLINSAGSLIAGVLWSVLIIFIMFAFWSILNITENFIQETDAVQTQTNSMFPFMLSFVWFFATTITMFVGYFFLTLTAGERYKKSGIIKGQIAFFLVLSYILIVPLYMYAWVKSYENILYVFLGHTLFVAFGVNIIIEILNNYRYVLTGIYGSFIGFVMSTFFVIFIFFSFTTGYAKLLSIIFLLPLITFSLTFFKELFSLVYYQYNRFTNLDQLGDIFYQIEVDEKADFEEALQKDTI